jgi:excisionase family DNA binding protein
MHPNQNGKLGAQEAAARLGLGLSTLAKLRISGGGPAFYKFGRRVLYDPKDLESWAMERRRNSTSDIGSAA